MRHLNAALNTEPSVQAQGTPDEAPQTGFAKAPTRLARSSQRGGEPHLARVQPRIPRLGQFQRRLPIASEVLPENTVDTHPKTHYARPITNLTALPQGQAQAQAPVVPQGLPVPLQAQVLRLRARREQPEPPPEPVVPQGRSVPQAQVPLRGPG